MVKHKRSSLSEEKRRLKEFLWLMIRKHQPHCPMCGELFVYADILPPRGIDNLTDHHEHGDHSNPDPRFRVLVHRECHKRHHVKDNILKPISSEYPDMQDLVEGDSYDHD